MTGRKTPDSEDGDALWGFAMRDVTPIEGGEAIQPPKPKKQPPSAGAPINALPVAKVVTKVAEVAKAPQSREVDTRTRQRLERGQMQIEGVLDLHGMSQPEAHAALNSFILGAAGRGARCVLVITGKGRGGAGILRARLPEWLEAPALVPHILQVTPARPNHGGGGAFYVLLRRIRG
ncbi:MAG: Smr/MutS family protein [Alphaproteobacteria bacterium]|nr:Smr/MutS family protein [Alphaproteobacteria bacterium]